MLRTLRVSRRPPVEAAESVDIRPLDEISEILGVSSRLWSSFPLRFGDGSGKAEEIIDSATGIGTAETNEINIVKTSVTRPARKCMIVGPADYKKI